MPAKFKPSERVHNRARGQRMDTSSGKNKRYKHYYLKNTSKQELFDAINSSRTKPKHKQKYVNELVRRGVKIEWLTKEEMEAKHGS